MIKLHQCWALNYTLHKNVLKLHAQAKLNTSCADTLVLVWTWLFHCRLCSHWPPSCSGSRARWHLPGWQTVGADARCSAAGRAPQSKPGRAEAQAAWPAVGGRVIENPNGLIHINLTNEGERLTMDNGQRVLYFSLFFLFSMMMSQSSTTEM